MALWGGAIGGLAGGGINLFGTVSRVGLSGAGKLGMHVPKLKNFRWVESLSKWERKPFVPEVVGDGRFVSEMASESSTFSSVAVSSNNASSAERLHE